MSGGLQLSYTKTNLQPNTEIHFDSKLFYSKHILSELGFNIMLVVFIIVVQRSIANCIINTKSLLKSITEKKSVTELFSYNNMLYLLKIILKPSHL